MSKDRNVADFKEKGALKAFACGVARAVKDFIEDNPDKVGVLKASTGFALLIGAGLTGLILNNPALIAPSIAGGAGLVDGFIQAETEKSIYGHVKDGIKYGIPALIKKGRER